MVRKEIEDGRQALAVLHIDGQQQFYIRIVVLNLTLLDFLSLSLRTHPLFISI